MLGTNDGMACLSRGHSRVTSLRKLRVSIATCREVLRPCGSCAAVRSPASLWLERTATVSASAYVRAAGLRAPAARLPPAPAVRASASTAVLVPACPQRRRCLLRRWLRPYYPPPPHATPSLHRSLRPPCRQRCHPPWEPAIVPAICRIRLLRANARRRRLRAGEGRLPTRRRVPMSERRGEESGGSGQRRLSARNRRSEAVEARGSARDGRGTRRLTKTLRWQEAEARGS